MELGQSFRDVGSGVFRFVYAWVVPSAVVVGIYILFAAPPSLIDALVSPRALTGGLAKLALASVITVTISTAVGLLSLPVYRFLEGYTMPRWLARRLRTRRIRERKRLIKLASVSRRRRDSDLELLLEKLALYPEDQKDVMPTRLGNGLRVMEQYADRRYDLDSQALWYELMCVAPAPLRADIDEARAPVDFFVSAVLHLSLLTLASSVTFLVDPSLRSAIVAFVALLLIPVAYSGAIRNLADYGSSVRALVNVGRLPLASALGLTIPANGHGERRMWRAVCDLVRWQTGNVERLQNLDEFRNPGSHSAPSSDTSPVTAA